MPRPLSGGALFPPEQQTLLSEAAFGGTGLHTGRSTRVTVAPAPPGHGLVFLARGQRVPAVAEYVRETKRCTALGVDRPLIQTAEHLLAALYALGIDNAEIRVEGPELPALDGSALPYAEGILGAGIVRQGVAPREVRLREVVMVQDGDRYVIAVPMDSLTVAAAVDFRRPLAGPQCFYYSLEGPQRSREAVELVGAAFGKIPAAVPPLRQPAIEGGTPLNTFLEEIAPARTFVFEDWIPSIRAAGLGTGGTVENTLVLFNNGTSTPMRFPDELVRHKTLDLLGDLALVGGRLQACVVAIKAGHSLHVAAAGRIRRMAYGADHAAA